MKGLVKFTKLHQHALTVMLIQFQNRITREWFTFDVFVAHKIIKYHFEPRDTYASSAFKQSQYCSFVLEPLPR